MTLEAKLDVHGFTLTDEEERRIRHQLGSLERRLSQRPEPTARLALERHVARRQVEVDLRVELGPLGPTLISHQLAEMPDHAVRLAVEDVERQLERHVASQRGESTFGVPSRREPESLRPHAPE